MLGVVVGTVRGEGDRLLSDVAARLVSTGLRPLGAVQDNIDPGDGRPCRMELRVLGTALVRRISQDLGPAARGCRLDPAALEEMVAAVAATFEAGGDILILNKFGKHEAQGRGFRPLIAQALERGLPVLTAVAPRNRAALDAFAEGLATTLPPDPQTVLTWVNHTLRV